MFNIFLIINLTIEHLSSIILNTILNIIIKYTSDEDKIKLKAKYPHCTIILNETIFDMCGDDNILKYLKLGCYIKVYTIKKNTKIKKIN